MHNALVIILSTFVTPWSRVLEKLIVRRIVKKFPAFYGNRKL